MSDHSTPATPPTPSALAADKAAVLLDRLIYEQVVACIDIEELHALEQAITLLAAELDGVGPDRAADLARAMLDAALRRLPDDLDRYLHGTGWLHGCPYCEEEEREARPARGGSGQRRGTRPRS